MTSQIRSRLSYRARACGVKRDAAFGSVRRTGRVSIPGPAMSVLSLLAFAVLLAWLWLLSLHGGFWRADIRLGPDRAAPAEWPQIVAIIPARNEADTIADTIAAHLACDYPGIFSVVLVDDQSTDATVENARAAASRAPDRLGIIRGKPLPAGWTGKLWAQAQGVEAAFALAPRARFFLLCDADIRFGPHTLRRLVARAMSDNLALVSLMSRLDARGLWAGVLIPAFILFFQKLYPFAWANSRKRKTAAAAGGVMLVATDRLRELNLPATIRGALIDDCTLAERIKHGPPPGRIFIGLAEPGEAVSGRDNRSLGSIWSMVARTAYAQLGYSALMLTLCLAGLAFVYLLGPAILLTWPWHKSGWAAVEGLGSWILMAIAFAPTLRDYGKPVWLAPLLPLAGFVYGLMTFDSARRSWAGKGGAWKGRTYPARGDGV